MCAFVLIFQYCLVTRESLTYYSWSSLIMEVHYLPSSLRGTAALLLHYLVNKQWMGPENQMKVALHAVMSELTDHAAMTGGYCVSLTSFVLFFFFSSWLSQITTVFFFFFGMIHRQHPWNKSDSERRICYC